MILCPRDGSELIEHADTVRPTWHCNSCGGAFIKGLPIHEYQSNGTQQPREQWDVEILCPEHNEMMGFLTVKGVTIDICAKCGGVWLDGGEIEALLGHASSKEIPIHCSAGGGWSEVDMLSPLIEAALGALFHG